MVGNTKCAMSSETRVEGEIDRRIDQAGLDTLFIEEEGYSAKKITRSARDEKKAWEEDVE